MSWLRELADAATHTFKYVYENAEEIAGKIAGQARAYGDKAQVCAGSSLEEVGAHV